MPLANEDRFFGAKKGSANKALEGMVKQYGYAEGHRVFYSMLADRKKAKRIYGRPGKRV